MVDLLSPLKTELFRPLFRGPASGRRAQPLTCRKRRKGRAVAGEGVEGRCTCGEIRYRMSASPLIVHACHCSECQRLSGAAFAVNAMVEADRVELLAGQPEPVAVTGTSGLAQTVMRCPACRVALWSHYPRSGRRIAFVRVGTLDEPARFPPDIHIFTSTKLPWLDLPDGARAVPEWYSPPEVWPAESLRRWQAAMAGA
jgi:hypothetical protein